MKRELMPAVQTYTAPTANLELWLYLDPNDRSGRPCARPTPLSRSEAARAGLRQDGADGQSVMTARQWPTRACR